ILDAYLYFYCFREAGHAVFWGCVICLLGFLYWGVRKEDLCKRQFCTLHIIFPLLPFSLGIAGSIWCYDNHICMCGHMAHPPYPNWHYILDTSWALSLIGSSYWFLRLRSGFAIAVTALGAFLLSYRFLFGSFGGVYLHIPL
ncbi:MAG: hypothetical protein ABIH23_03935, partial [bacterium]